MDRVDTEDFRMLLPDETTYKDINTSTSIPTFQMANINSWLAENGKSISTDNPPSLYTSKFLKFIRATEKDDVTFLKSQCHAEMKKHVSYWIDISIASDGTILEGQCDCAAGMGPKAHCKHICALLYALHDFTCNGKLFLQTTCTQELQSFHKVKPFLASPLKADIVIPRNSITDASGSSRNSLPLNYDPRNEQFINLPGYNAFVRNLVLNYCYQSPLGDASMPITQLYAPANPYALELDHQYFAKCITDKQLDDLFVTAITPEAIASIERRTRGQADNKTWLDERCLRLQASNYGKICKCTNRTDKYELAKRFTMHNDLSKVPAIVYGKANESTALLKYEEYSKKKVHNCGIFVCKKYSYLAASPDAIVDDDLIVEIKCPYSARNQIITNVTVPYMQAVVEGDRTVLKLDMSHDYYYQIQGQLLASERSQCDFVVFTQKDFCVTRIDKNQTFIDQMVEKLTVFFNEYFKPALKEAIFYHNYKSFNF
jgi:hypothetical protein